MTPARRRRVLVAALLVVAAVAAWMQVAPRLGGDGIGTSGPRGTGGPAAGDVDIVTLDVDSLAAAPRDYSPGRNPFAYGEPPPPPGPTPEELAERARLEEERRRTAEEARLAAEERARLLAENPPEPPKPQPPEFRMTYLGSFGPASRRIAVFTDGEEIYNALVGDVLAGQFVVEDIGYESVAIAFVDFPDEPPRRFAIGS